MSHHVDEDATYEIRIQERLDERWSDWLSGATVAFEGEPGGPGSTVLIVRLDQAALRGLLNRLWDLNLTVVSVDARDTHVESPAPRTSGVDMVDDCDAVSQPESTSPLSHRARVSLAPEPTPCAIGPERSDIVSLL
jgi:hypothetical protein